MYRMPLRVPMHYRILEAILRKVSETRESICSPKSIAQAEDKPCDNVQTAKNALLKFLKKLMS